MNKTRRTKEKDMKTIALVCTALCARGGTSQDMLNIYKKINRADYRVLIAYCSIQNKLLENFFLEGGVNPADLFCFSADRKTLFIPLLIRLRRLFIDQRVDIVHTFFLHSDIIGFFAAFLGGVKCLLSSVHGKFIWDEVNGVNKIKQNFYKFVNMFIRKYFYATIAVSYELFREVGNYFTIEKSKVVVIPVGVNMPSQVDIQASRSSFLNKPIVIGTICRLTKDKGLPYLIEAASHLIAKIDSVKFIIAGEGEEEKELRRIVNERKLAPWITISGRVESLTDFFKAIDIFTMTSIREGCPTALLEALSFCKPVVAFASSGVNEIITDRENGVLVKPFNVEAFGRALLELCNNREYAQSLGVNGRRCVQDKYTIEKEISGIRQLYSKGLSIQ